jgi:hypothetical protein
MTERGRERELTKLMGMEQRRKEQRRKEQQQQTIGRTIVSKGPLGKL